MTPLYRIAVAADREAWIALRQELWPQCPMARHALEVQQLLASQGVVAVAQLGDTLAGFAEVSIRHDHVEGAGIAPVPYLEGWYVRAAYRRLGVGRGLLRFVEAWARESGYTEIASDAESDNADGIRLHGKVGFREVGRNVCFIKRIGAPGP